RSASSAAWISTGAALPSTTLVWILRFGNSALMASTAWLSTFSASLAGSNSGGYAGTQPSVVGHSQAATAVNSSPVSVAWPAASRNPAILDKSTTDRLLYCTTTTLLAGQRCAWHDQAPRIPPQHLQPARRRLSTNPSSSHNLRLRPQ